MRKPRVNHFAANPWTQAMYDIRELLLPRYPATSRGDGLYKKAILFHVAAAGIPSAEYPFAGYKNRLEILALTIGMEMKSLQRHISDLESMDLLISKGIGPNLPKLRLINEKEINRIVTLQKRDLDLWMERYKDADENSPRLLFVPENYHLRISNPWEVPSSTSLDTQVDTQLDAPIGAHLETKLVNQGEQAMTNCSAQHGWGLSCAQCDDSTSKDYSITPEEYNPSYSPKHDL